MYNKIKHLEMLQVIINRLGNNSFLIKGWCLTVVSGILTIALSNGYLSALFLPFLPIILFWVLDGYFLWQERLFRILYDKVRIKEELSIDFAMDTKDVLDKENTWWQAIMSRTLIIYYGSFLLSIFFIMIVIYFF